MTIKSLTRNSGTQFAKPERLLKSSRRLRLAMIFAATLYGTYCLPLRAQTINCGVDAPPQVLEQAAALQRMDACNRDIINARRMIVASQSDQAIAQQAPNPTLTLGVGSVSPKNGIGTGSYWSKTVDTSVRYEQLIERGGKRELRSMNAQQLLRAAEQDIRDVVRQQSVAVLQAMVDLAAANERTRLLSEIAVFYEDTLRANTRRIAVGDLAPIDAQRQAIDATRAQIDLRQARADTARARSLLAGLLAWESQANALQVDPAILDILPLPAETVNPEERSDVAAARRRLEAARVQRDLASAQSKPDLTAGLQLDHWPTSASNPAGTGNTISMTISLPFMLRHHFDGELARATSDSEAADETLQRVAANAQGEWNRINADLENGRARLELLRTQQAPRAEQVARAAELGYSKGALSVLELLDARRVLRQTQLDTLAARADLARATISRNQWVTSDLESRNDTSHASSR